MIIYRRQLKNTISFLLLNKCVDTTNIDFISISVSITSPIASRSLATGQVSPQNDETRVLGEKPVKVSYTDVCVCEDVGDVFE